LASFSLKTATLLPENPNFRPNNSKQGQKNCPWPEKLEAVKWQNLAKSGQKEAEKYFQIIYL
jgi:hypothetical protein